MEDEISIVINETKETRRRIRLTPSLKSKLNNYIDISNGKENTPVLLLKAHRKKLSKFDYMNNYITTSSILGSRSLDDYLLSREYSCSCTTECIPSICECIVNHVQRYECNSNCACVSCDNRMVQLGIKKDLKVGYINKTKGFGVFAQEKIYKDEFICEYIGVITPKLEATEKIKMGMMRKRPNYILQVREDYANMTVNTFIDAETYGNVSRFLNHSCEPNLYFDIIRVNHFIPQVAFFAKRDIEPGEELTFSYCDFPSGSSKEGFDSYKRCECKSEKCRLFLPS